MAHPSGTYLGGIRTVEDLRQRCRVDDQTGCWHWGLAIVQGMPSVHFLTPDTAKRVKMRGRRAALYLQRGKDLPRGHVAFAQLCCHADDCVNPGHSRSGNRMAHGEWMRKTGAISGLASKAAASLKGWDGRRKLTPEQVMEIRSSPESNRAIGKRLGVSEFCIWSVRAWKTHKNVGPFAGMFRSLMAASNDTQARKAA